MVSIPTITVEADFNRDGVYEQALAGYIPPDSALQIQRGANKYGQVQVSQVTLPLQNRDGIFNPLYLPGTLVGKIVPGVPIRLTASLNGVTFTLWTGYLKRAVNRWQLTAAGYRSRAEITAHDLGQFLVDYGGINVLTSTRLSGAALTQIFTAMGLTSSDYYFDPGAQSLEYHFVRRQAANEAINDVLNSEMGGSFWIRPDGRARFQDRAARLGVSRLAQAIKSLRPVGYWRLGELSGTTAADASGNGRTGTYNGPTLGVTGLATGDADLAADFSGASQRVTIADNNAWSIDTTGFLSGFALVDLDTTPGTNYTVLAKGAAGQYEWQLRVDSSRNLNLTIFKLDGSLAVATVTGATVLALNTTYAVGFSVDYGDYARVYVNGAQDGQTTSFSSVYSNGTAALEIGRRGDDVHSWDGVIDEAAVFNTALSDYDHHLLYLASIGVWTWGDGTNIRAQAAELEIYDAELTTIVNVQPSIRSLGQADTEIFRFSRGKDTRPSPDSMALAAGEIYEAEFDYAAPIAALTTPVARSDYLANSALDGSSTDRTSSLTVTVTDLGAGFHLKLVNTHTATIYVTFFRLRGQPVDFVADRPVFTFAKSIPNLKADRSLDVQVPFASDAGNKARDYAVQLLRTLRYPYPLLKLSFRWVHDDIVRAMLALDYGDLVNYVDDAGAAYLSTQANDWWYVQAVNLTVQPGKLGRAEVQLVPSYLYRNLDAIIFDLFTRSDAVGDLGSTTSGHTWTSDTTFDINGNKARPNSTAACLPAISGGLGSADMVVEVDLGNLTGDTDEKAGVCLRVQDSSNHLRAYWSDVTDQILLTKVVAGVETSLDAVSYTPSSTCALRVMAQGTRLRVEADGILLIDLVDGTHRDQTGVGLYAENTTTVTLDDFYAQGL